MKSPRGPKPKSKDEDEIAYEAALIRRVQVLRRAVFPNQRRMAAALGISDARYNKFEQRPLPPYLFERFKRVTGTDLHYLVTGVPETPNATGPGVHKNKDSAHFYIDYFLENLEELLRLLLKEHDEVRRFLGDLVVEAHKPPGKRAEVQFPRIPPSDEKDQPSSSQ